MDYYDLLQHTPEKHRRSIRRFVLHPDGSVVAVTDRYITSIEAGRWEDIYETIRLAFQHPSPPAEEMIIHKPIITAKRIALVMGGLILIGLCFLPYLLRDL